MRRWLIIVIAIFSALAHALDRKPTSIKSFDGFPLDALIEIPNGIKKSEVKHVLVFAHGSGPQNLDVDLSFITLPQGSENLFFRDIADALRKEGFATLRYNKRAFEAKKKIEANPSYRNSKEFKKYAEHPLEYFIKDNAFFATHAKKEFPNAEVYLLGHSEGTGVVLNVASQNKSIKGVVLIGFSNENFSSSILEQTVYRHLHLFTGLDKNKDGVLSPKEMKVKGNAAKTLREQMPILDRNKDNNLSISEFKAGNYSNLLMRDDLYSRAYLLDEAKLPRPSTLIKEAGFKILFLQGEYDNQTPAYFTEAIELINGLVWKKKNLKFVYFPKAGHALDPREDINDISYRVLPQATLGKIGQEIANFFK